MHRRSFLTALGVALAATALSFVVAPVGAVPDAPSATAPSGDPARAAPSGDPARAAPSGDPAPAAPSGEPSPLRASSDRVVAYTMSAELVPETHTVRGRGTIVWRNTARVAADRLYVHLYLNAFRNDRTVFWRTPVHGFRGDALDSPGRIDVTRFFVRELERDLWPSAPTTPGDPEDATDIELSLPRPIEPGESLTIEAEWTSQLPSVTLRTGYTGSFHMVAQWFPKLARLEPDGTWAHFPFHRMSEFYADYGTYDVTVTAPEAFVVGAVGSLVSRRIEAAADPAPDPSAAPPAPSSAAPAPDPSAAPPAPSSTTPRLVQRFLASDVHDFAFAAWDRFRTLEETTDAGVKLAILYPEGHDEVARVQLDAVRYGLGYFGAAFGRYPYGTLTIVHPPREAIEAGGMEYPTLITTGGSWMRGPLETRELEILTLHELAHQWFYGLVGTNEHRWPFLDEGLTSYAESDAAEARWPDASGGQGFGLRIGMPAVYRAGALAATGNARVSDAASEFVSGVDYGALVYARSATTLRTLGNVYGQDTVRRAIGLYARRYRFAHPTADDFFDAMRETLGAEAEAALRVALTEPSTVDYVATGVESWHRTNGKTGYEGHALVRRRGAIRLPVEVLLIAEDGTTRGVRWDAAATTELIPYEGESPLVAVVIDPEHRVLLDEDLTNNAFVTTGARSAPRVLEGLSFVAGVLARGLLP